MAKKRKTKRKASRAIGLSPKSDREFEIRSAADTLIRAEEIKADRSMMKDVKTEIRRRASAAQKASK